MFDGDGVEGRKEEVEGVRKTKLTGYEPLLRK